MTFAKVVLSGSVIASPEKRFTPNNTAVANFDLKVTPSPRFNGQVDEPYTVKVTCWTRLAEGVSEQLQPGDQVIVEGKLLINTFQTPEGVQKKTFEIEAHSVDQISGAVKSITAESVQTTSNTAPAPTPTSPAPAMASASAPSSSGTLPPDDSLTEDDIPF